MLSEDHRGFCYVPGLVKHSVTLLQYRKRPLKLCLECWEPLPEIRTVNMVVHEGVCKKKRRDRTTAQANERRKKARRK
jgi:hypothetical protein